MSTTFNQLRRQIDFLKPISNELELINKIEKELIEQYDFSYEFTRGRILKHKYQIFNYPGPIYSGHGTTKLKSLYDALSQKD